MDCIDAFVASETLNGSGADTSLFLMMQSLRCPIVTLRLHSIKQSTLLHPAASRVIDSSAVNFILEGGVQQQKAAAVVKFWWMPGLTAEAKAGVDRGRWRGFAAMGPCCCNRCCVGSCGVVQTVPCVCGWDV
jgi:hypothetical protein